ncbi:MAG TPA: hypothetical protein VFV19_05925 [Candidatus Polarisedimenticolaceae bacterium]|nr:hypothetical protein [Candidatus Polarisedimenticolaceae bacterium]
MLGVISRHRTLRAPADAGWLHVMGRTDPGRGGAEAVVCLAGACSRLPVDVHAYCVLPRHFHILVRAALRPAYEAARRIAPPTDAAIKIIGITFGRHLMEVSRYIHLNPVEAGVAAHAADWPFSSLRSYLGDPAAPRWLVTQAVLGRFGTIGARHRYRAYVEAGLDRGTRDANGRPRWDALFAAGSGLENTAWRVEPVLAPRRPAPAHSTIPTHAPWPKPALAHAVASRFSVPVAAIRSPREGGPKAALARGAFIHEARAGVDIRLTSLARWLGYRSAAGASAAVDRYRRSWKPAPSRCCPNSPGVSVAAP